MYSKGEGVVGARECFERVIACDIDLFISQMLLFSLLGLSLYTYSLIKFKMKNGVYYMHYTHTKFGQKKNK